MSEAAPEALSARRHFVSDGTASRKQTRTANFGLWIPAIPPQTDRAPSENGVPGVPEILSENAVGWRGLESGDAFVDDELIDGDVHGFA